MMLLLLMMYIFAVLGVYLFGKQLFTKERIVLPLVFWSIFASIVCIHGV